MRSPPARVAFFAALCLFLSTVEYAIPKPLPIMRLGLANLPLLLALSTVRTGDFFLLILLKVLLQGLVSGTLFSYVALFSAAGSFASGLVMFFLYHTLRGKAAPSLIGLSVAGAMGNNAAQLFLGRFLLFGEGTRYIAPFLLGMGTITGVLLGMFAERFARESTWFLALKEGRIFYTEDTEVCITEGTEGRFRVFPALTVSMGVIFFSFLVPNGKVLYSIGDFIITEGALIAGVRRAAVLVGTVFLSQLVLKYLKPLKKSPFFSSLFIYYSRITLKKITFKKEKIIKTIDQHLLKCFPPCSP